MTQKKKLIVLSARTVQNIHIWDKVVLFIGPWGAVTVCPQSDVTGARNQVLQPLVKGCKFRTVTHWELQVNFKSIFCLEFVVVGFYGLDVKL